MIAKEFDYSLIYSDCDCNYLRCDEFPRYNYHSSKVIYFSINHPLKIYYSASYNYINNSLHAKYIIGLCSTCDETDFVR